MPVNEDPPSRSASATFLDWAALALRLRGLINVALCLVVHSTVAQCLALRTAKDIFDLVVLKLVTSEVPMRLVASIDHRDIRLDASLQQPRQKLSTAVGLIRSHTLGTDAEPLFHLCEHAARRQRLLPKSCLRCFHSQNDTTGIVHQIVI